MHFCGGCCDNWDESKPTHKINFRIPPQGYEQRKKMKKNADF